MELRPSWLCLSQRWRGKRVLISSSQTLKRISPLGGRSLLSRLLRRLLLLHVVVVLLLLLLLYIFSPPSLYTPSPIAATPTFYPSSAPIAPIGPPVPPLSPRSRKKSVLYTAFIYLISLAFRPKKVSVHRKSFRNFAMQLGLQLQRAAACVFFICQQDYLFLVFYLESPFLSCQFDRRNAAHRQHEQKKYRRRRERANGRWRRRSVLRRLYGYIYTVYNSGVYMTRQRDEKHVDRIGS